MCSHRGIHIPCNRSSLLAGAKVHPTCKQFYKYGNFVPDNFEITCKKDGTWDNPIFSCIPGKITLVSMFHT